MGAGVFLRAALDSGLLSVGSLRLGGSLLGGSLLADWLALGGRDLA